MKIERKWLIKNLLPIEVEVEFDSVEDAEKYIFPWAVEITYDTKYKIKNY